MKAIWSGALAFGQVTVPIKLYSASKKGRVSLRMIEKDTHCPVRYQKICETTGEIIPDEKVVRGYEYEEGKYVEIDEADLAKATPRQIPALDIINFVSENEIDLKLFAKPYYIEPEDGFEKTYVLLREGMEKERRLAIARAIIRGREVVMAIYVEGSNLIANQLRFEHEIIPTQELDIPTSALFTEEKFEASSELIKRMSRPFSPSDYKDQYTETLRELIKEKVVNKKPKKDRPKHIYTNMDEIFNVLEESASQR